MQVYTAAIPKIGVRRPAEHSPSSADSNAGDVSDTSTSDTREDAESSLPSTANGETTPQASRHVSTSDIQAPQPEADTPGTPRRSCSSPLPSTPPLSAGVHRTISESMNGEESPVMNETLSVIDEHITDLNTPRHSFIAPEPNAATDSASEYSSHVDNRLSYIHGHETDEEEGNQPTEEQIRSWDHIETARQLRILGVESRHCEIFEEQEITGDVLLDMDQEFIFMKEFDFGVMGRRLKTWHKIKAFQEEVKGLRQPRGSVSSYSPRDGPPEEFERSGSRAGHTGPFLPRIPSLSGRPSTSYHRRGSTPSIQHSRLGHSGTRSNQGSPFSHTPSQGKEPPSRPSAASIDRSRRHSSIDATARSPVSGRSASPAYQKEPSFDRGWTMSNGAQTLSSRPGTALGSTGGASPRDVSPRQTSESPDANNDLGSVMALAARFDELDRGYFSGGEVESRRSHKVLQKRSSAAGSISHSRKSSSAEEQSKKSPSSKRHSRFGSADSIRDMIPHVSAAAKACHGGSKKGRFRSSTTVHVSDKPGQQSNSPSVTHVEGKSNAGPLFFSPFAPIGGKTDADSSGRSSPLPLQQIKSVGPKFRRVVGLRSVSDAVVHNDKGSDVSSVPASPVQESHPPSRPRTGSTTPSATSKSSERQSTDGSGKTADGGLPAPRPKMPAKVGSKSKKDTSAYMRGLEKKTPQEQMVDCDFCGWMKKKSSSLMTTWKPRLFILRGRRLSYYYSEDDTEERGLIDITAHRVLRADQDPIIALHATITGATASPTAPANSSGFDFASSDQAASSDVSSRSRADSDGPFFFKLVPPKSGYARTVQFTKPTVHYFQVDNIKQGRLWMAALMKATIERDLNAPVETTNKQKTISLRQARLLHQRPPELLGPPDKESVDSSSKDDNDDLKIQGLNLDQTSSGDDSPDKNSMLNKLGGLDTGPTSLLPESLAGSTT